ncbi:MAG: J domain-containing protein [Candidatus Avelusimicrobium sp.]|uniref:J domain-containing protein n=1 Tax=Candidatus Avelusimicrobium sp. TaxID=3048833 RepID=UPI003F02BAC8
MTTWLCRLMAAVFTLNVLAPTDLLAQTRPAAPRVPRLSQQAPVPSTEEIRAQVEEKFQDKVSAAQEKYEEAKGVRELYAAVKNLHSVMNSRAAENQRRQADADKRREMEQAMQNRYTQPADATYVAPRVVPLRKEGFPNFNEFVSKLDSGDMALSDLILHLDPLEGGSLMYTVFAAEIFGNSVDAMGQNEEDQTKEMADFLLEVQLRAMYRLQSLSSNKEDSSTYLMALGSLRLLLLKVNSFFKRAGMPNPLFEAAGSSSGSGSASKPAPSKQPTMVRVNGLDGHVMYVARPAKGSGSAKAQAPKPLFTEAMYGKMMNDIMAEIRAYKEQDLSETDADYSDLILSLEYAVSYVMDFDPSQVSVMVKLFDQGPKKTDFKQQYSGVLNAIFTSVFENVKFTPGNDKHTQAINMFREFSNPEKYSIPTRIFALEMASLLYRPYNAETLVSKNVKQEPANPLGNSILSSFFVVNTSPVDPKLRPVFAERTADIYCPLTYTHYLAMKDYGLDSDQMKALADKLAYIYDGFYDISTPTFSMPGNDPHHWSSKCHIAMKNQPNMKKRYDETMMSITLFVGEAILWVFGGEIIGIAWRVTRGAMVALPKAVRAASLANKGRRALSFGIEIKKGVRYANLAYTTRLNGITVAATRVEEVRKPAAAAANAAGAGSASAAAPANALRLAPPPVTSAASGVPLLPAASETAAASASKPGWWSRVRSWWTKKPYTVAEESVTSPITSMRDFRNSRGWWRGSRAPVEEWNVLIQEPGFGFQSAALSGPRAARLRNGIQNWDDWRYLMRSARTAEGGMLQFTAPLKPWRSLWQGMWKPMFLGSQSSAAGVVQQEQRIMGATGRAFAKDAKKVVGEGVFDYWKYTENGWVRIDQKQFMELGDGLQTAAKEAVPDYYAVMGVGRDASAQQIKSAYRKLATKLHPDRGGDPDMFRQLAEAWRTLGNEASRAAYDAKLLAAPKNVAAVVLPESPEGMSLAITRNMGREIPAGFSPLTESSQGLGFNAANWGAVDVQLSKHLAATGQTSVLQPTLAMTDPFIGGTAANSVFFGSWAALDQAVNPFMQSWIASTSAEEIGKLQKKHGNAYDPALMAEDQQIANETLRDLQAQGYNTASPSTYEAVTAAQRPSALGALISFPMLAGWQGLSKNSVAQTLGLKSPFDSEQTRTLLQIGADRIQTQRMVRKYQNAKTQKDFDTFYNSVMTALENSKTSYLQAIAQMSQMPGAGNLSAERQEVLSYFDSVKRSVEQIAKGSGDVNQKCEKINRVWASVEAKVPEFDDALLQKSVAPEGEEAFFRSLIANYEEQCEDSVRNLREWGYEAAAGKAEKIFRDMLAKVRKAQKKKGSFSARYQAVVDASQEMNRKLEELYQGLSQSSSAQGTMTVEQLRDAAFQFIDGMEAQAKAQGLQAGTFFQEWRAKVTAYCNDSTYTPETLQMTLQMVNLEQLDALDALIMKAAKEQPSSHSAPAAEAGALSSDELDELLPDATSEISTGA